MLSLVMTVLLSLKH